MMHLAGAGVEKNEGLGIWLSNAACGKSHADAMVCLAAYLDTEEDTHETIGLLEKAAMLGHLEGAYRMARIYEKGEKGRSKSLQKAAARYGIASRLGHKRAPCSLGNLYAAGSLESGGDPN
mgnify:FL=1